MEMFKHQLDGVKFLLARRGALLADEMGLGKTRQAVAAAYELWRLDTVAQVLVLCPAGVAYAWEQELEKLTDGDTRLSFQRYRPGRKIKLDKVQRLNFLIVSYDTAWREPHLSLLARWCQDASTLLVCDESSFLKSRTAKRTKRALKLRDLCERCWLLTGTPVTNSPLDLWSQLQVADSSILRRFNNFYHFRARYARMGGFQFRQVIGYENLDELRRLVAPHALRREKTGCLDLPPKLYTTREVALEPATWKIYKELREEAVAALSDAETQLEPNAGVRLLRLAQLTSGILGGQSQVAEQGDKIELGGRPEPPRDVSDEKLRWAVEHLTNDERPAAVIVWCRWRRERERLFIEFIGKERFIVYQIYGGQPKRLREEAIAAFSELHAGTYQRKILLAQPHAGGFGLNLTAATEAIYLSHDFSLETRLQSEDRCHRIGQRSAVTYVDVLATGPAGQRTIDHVTVRALRQKQDLAAWTCAAWKRALTEEAF